MAFFRDFRFAARRLTAAPGYTVAAVATLALAIGASTAIFSAVYSVLLKPMPIRQPEQLAVRWGGGAALAMRVVELSYLDIRDMGEAAPRIGRVASIGAAAWSAVLDGQGESVRLAQFGVSGTFFEVMGAAPHLGRMLEPSDDVANRAGRSRGRPSCRRSPRFPQPRILIRCAKLACSSSSRASMPVSRRRWRPINGPALTPNSSRTARVPGTTSPRTPFSITTSGRRGRRRGRCSARSASCC